MLVPEIYYKGTNWWIHMHALTDEQMVPKLSHYYSSISSRVADMMTSAPGKSISDDIE